MLLPEASVKKHVPCHVKKHVLYQPGSARDKAVVTLGKYRCYVAYAAVLCHLSLRDEATQPLGVPD